MRLLLERYACSCDLARPVRLRLCFVRFRPADIAFRAGSSAGIGFGARCIPSRSRISSEISAPSANPTEVARTKRDSDRRVRTKRKCDRATRTKRKTDRATRTKRDYNRHSGQDCVSCGTVGWNRAWCALQTPTKPNSIRNLRTKRKCDRRFRTKRKCDRSGPHQARFRPKNPEPSASATEVG